MDSRVRRSNKSYKAINRSSANDIELSLKAKGLMFYFLSKPDGWRGQVYDVCKNCKDGRKSILTAVRELKEAGYIRVVSVKEAGKFRGKYYQISDEKRKVL